MPYDSYIARGPAPTYSPDPGTHPLIPEGVKKPIIKGGKGQVRPSASGKSKGSRRK